MLQMNKRVLPSDEKSWEKRVLPSDERPVEPGTSLVDALRNAIRIVRCQLLIMSVILLHSVALALIYLLIAPPKFTATGEMVIDARKVQLLQQQSVLSDAQIDASTSQTQVEVLKSKNISLAVIRKLHLTKDPEFGERFIDRALGFVFGQGEAPTEPEKEESALDYFQEHRTVKRQGLTSFIQVDFTSLDPGKSAEIVNAIMSAYVEDQRASKYEAARRASEWLFDRIKELRAQATATEGAVVEFRDKNNIVDTGGPGLGYAQGRLLLEQRISEVNSALTLASTATAEAKARLERIRELVSGDIPDASVADALKSEVIIKARGQYLDLAQREAFFSQKYGETHMATVNLRMQMQEVRHSIAEEMRKIAGSYKSDYEIALARENSLRKTLEAIVDESHVANQAQIKLRELKGSADAARSLYENFQQRYMEAVQQRDSIPISESRLISVATPPSKSSSPKKLRTLALSLVGGSLLGFAVAYLREANDRVFRTTGQVEGILQVNCLAMVPALKTTSPDPGCNSREERESFGNRSLARGNRDFLRYVVEAPFSQYAEAIKLIKIAADLSGALNSSKVIGLTSTLPNEGKSTIASNLAHLIADAGASVILVDADLRNPSLTQRLAPNSLGLIEAVRGSLSLDSAITGVPSSKLKFLCAGTTSNLRHTNEILASASMKTLIDALRPKYDYVIVDLSPVAPIADVRTTGHFIDTYVFVVEWGRTKVKVIERGFTDAQGVYDRLLGVVLNKVELEAQGRYESYHGNHYQRKYYS
jgi:polysaccharide biosynthesis transport protein